jgi:hypothetical protein
MRSMTSSTPSTTMPNLVLEVFGRSRRRLVESRSSAAVGSASAASPSFRRCMILLITTPGLILVAPRAT